MARILDCRKTVIDTSRFSHVTHHNSIWLTDRFNANLYLIECESRKEMYKMCLWDDLTWEDWITQSMESKSNG